MRTKQRIQHMMDETIKRFGPDEYLTLSETSGNNVTVTEERDAHPEEIKDREGEQCREEG